MSPDKYDDSIQKLQDSGQGASAGRTYHTAFVGRGSVTYE